MLPTNLHATAALTDQQEDWADPLVSLGALGSPPEKRSCQGECSLQMQLPLVSEIGSYQKTSKQANNN